MFGRAAVADEDSNPLDWFISFGIGGNSPIACRQDDTFGVGWHYSSTSNQLPGLLLGDYGQAVELFYNAEVRRWLHVTADIQFVDPSARLIDDSVVFGLRAQVDL